MKIGLVASPFIPVPPHRYGGTELFVATLAEALVRQGHDVIVYANGESRVGCEVRGVYERADWPVSDALRAQMKELVHTAYACADLERECDVIHVNNAPAVTFSVLSRRPFVCTLHHPHEDVLSEVYERYPAVQYVAISEYQARQEHLPRLQSIHHGLNFSHYDFVDRKDDYLVFLGRIAPVKGAHLAIDVARKSGIPLKIAGEIQPAFMSYWESEVKPRVDGRFIEYVGEADLALKNELLGRARALLFPIRWHEPFGLIMLEAMACGTPVLALPGGAVEEVVENGVSGWICRDVEEMAARANHPAIDPRRCRGDAEHRFSDDVMARNYLSVYSTSVSDRRQTRSEQLFEPAEHDVRAKRARDEDRVEAGTV